jgi:hypothetical protein
VRGILEKYLEKPMTSFRGIAKISLDACKRYPVDFTGFIVKQHRSELLPAFRLTDVDECANATPTKYEHRLSRLR